MSKAELKYESFEWSKILVGIMAIFIIISYLSNVPSYIAIVLIGVMLLFYGMTTTVSATVVRVKFGIGLIQFKWKIEDIVATEIATSKWYYGIGIRVIPKGMLYNAHSLKCVELRFTNKSSIVKIGTPNPEALQRAILGE